MYDRLFYLFFAGALALAAWLAYSGDEALKQSIGPLFPILLGLSMIFLARNAVGQGRVRGRRRYFRRAEYPETFWSIVGFRYAIGVVLTCAGLWLYAR